MILKPMKTARRLKLKSHVFEVFGLTSIVTLTVLFLGSLSIIKTAPVAGLLVQLTLLIGIFVFIQHCARRQSLAIVAVVKDRVLDLRAALKE